MYNDDGVIWICQEALVNFMKVLFHYSSTAKKSEGIITIASNVAKNQTTSWIPNVKQKWQWLHNESQLQHIVSIFHSKMAWNCSNSTGHDYINHKTVAFWFFPLQMSTWNNCFNALFGSATNWHLEAVILNLRQI
jgi:hypothetical protein